MARKHIDQNGYLVLEANPISMVGVFPYTGEQIDFDGSFGLDKKRIYYVFRPPEELFSKEAMKSFDGMPLTIGHEMLGKGFKAVDRKNHEGCIYNVRPSMDMPGYLLADFTIYTDRAKKAIENGTKQLSLGYRCQYEKRNGEHEGQPYEFVQTNLRGNHIALVPQGRCGSSVCVCDQALVLTCDSLPEEIQMNKKEEKKTDDRYERLAAAVANGSDEDCEACLDFFDLTPEQRKEALAFAKGKKKEAPATDAKPKCKDEMPPAPPAAVETEEEEEEKADGEKVEKAGIAVATPEGAEGVEATEVEKPEGEAEDGCKCKGKGKGKKAEDCGKVAKDCGGKAKDEVVAGMATDPNAPAATIPLKKGAKAEKDDKPCKECKDDNPADGKCDNCGKPVEEHAEDEAGKGTKPHVDKDGKCEEGCNVQCDGDDEDKKFSKAEMDEAIKKAKAEGRKDGLRAKALADAVSGIKGVGAVSCDEMTEVEVARYAAKRIPELAFAQDAADEVVLGAVKGHLAALKGRVEKPAKVFSVAKDSAIAKPQRVCTTDALSKYLAS